MNLVTEMKGSKKEHEMQKQKTKENVGLLLSGANNQEVNDME